MGLYFNEPEKQQTLPQDVFERLRSDIVSGALKAGEKLTEQRICDDYRVSRTPVREAFQKLELDGLIEIIPNRGAFVVGFSPQDSDDMYCLRSSYEAIAVQWAIERQKNGQLEELREILDLMEFFTMKKDVPRMRTANIKFHEKIYEMTGNRILSHVLSSFQVYTKNVCASDEEVQAFLPDILDEHQAIYDAIVAKDLTAAKLAAENHIKKSKERACGL